jgi:hypothetical protein
LLTFLPHLCIILVAASGVSIAGEGTHSRLTEQNGDADGSGGAQRGCSPHIRTRPVLTSKGRSNRSVFLERPQGAIQNGLYMQIFNLVLTIFSIVVSRWPRNPRRFVGLLTRLAARKLYAASQAGMNAVGHDPEVLSLWMDERDRVYMTHKAKPRPEEREAEQQEEPTPEDSPCTK